jgi:hypothetical protein
VLLLGKAVEEGSWRIALLSGKTRVEGAPLEMSLESMSGDLVALLKTLFPIQDEAPAFLLVGHSMVRRSALALIRVR